ncbi:AAA family ATPase [Azospirillum sp. A23]|uniref:AAA family ATPase n=1 Tax=Azospirillum sp. A23 TaxID=3160608 RepID=UPI0036F2710D
MSNQQNALNFYVRHIRDFRKPDASLPRPLVLIVRDGWNDYGYRTLCDVVLFRDKDDAGTNLGQTKIMKIGQGLGSWTFSDATEPFTCLDKEIYCSISGSEEYYKNIVDLGVDLAKEILVSLCDAAYNPEIFEKFQNDECFQTSLLRYRGDVIGTRDMLNSILNPDNKLVDNFTYKVRIGEAQADHEVDFDFESHDGLPYRMFMLAGVNGVGKTQLLAKLAIAVSGHATSDAVSRKKDLIEASIREKLMAAGVLSPPPSFYSVIAVSFNAFDEFELPKLRELSGNIRYTYCGIRKEDGSLCSSTELVTRIVNAIGIMSKERINKLRDILPRIIGNAEAAMIAIKPESGAKIYAGLSAGQRIILNIVTHIIANIDERSLILFDEPEVHLHPTLMTTLVSVVNDLLNEYKAFAIVSTHSPIVAQQIPSRSIRVVSRNGDVPVISPPGLECFGESLSAITQKLFGAAEGDRDYTDALEELLKKNNNNIEAVLSLFDNELSLNAQLFLRSISKAEK